MALKALMRIQLLKELTSLVKALKEGGLKPIERLGKIKRVGEVRRQLTNAPLEAYAKEADNAPVKKSLGARQKLNNAAIEALRKVQAGDAQRDDPAIREALNGYSGSGGGLKSASGESGSPHEYYTPKPVAHAMWTLLSGLGFTGGKVLDPSAGMGVFAQTKPSNVAVEQVELDNVSGEINSILNDSATVSTKISPFEAMAADTEDESYDAVVTNVPFGDNAMRGAAYKLDKKYQKANLQEYFLLRGLDKIKAGGYASFIVPSGVVSGKGGRAQKLRVALSFKSEFIGAYRLPNQVFDEAGADVITDVVIFRKHGKEQFAKIEELKQQSATVLTEAKVLWDVFLDGNYFKLDGKKYQIGTSTMGMGKFCEVEKVVYEGDIVSVAKLMRPFDKSGRIDWELLNTVETAPIVYSEGDTVYSGGALLQFKDGALVPVEGGIAVTDDVAEATKAKIGTVFDCVNNGVTLEDVTRVVENETREGRINDLPMWVRAVSRFGADAGQAGYIAAVTGLCVRELADKDGKNNGTNYGEQFPTLSGLLAKSKRDAAKLKSKSGGNELIGTALASVSLACNKSGFTPWWKGEINAESQELMRPESAYDKAKNDLAEGDEYVDVATIKAASSSFDPLNDDEYAISADGSGVMHIKDYYVGSYKDFLERAKQELEQATDPAVKEKLLKQHARAMSQLSIVNVSDMAFNLHSPYVSNEDKLAFLKQYVDSSYELSTNADGDVTFAYAAGTLSKNSTANEELNDKIKRRLVHYLNKGTVRTGSIKLDLSNMDQVVAEEVLQERLSAFISQTNSSFDSWVKASELKDKIATQLNAPENLRFTEIPDYAPLDIENWNPERKPHGYQSAAVRRFAKRFSGILGLDVGLGKAQPLDSKILTPTGWVLMGDIKAGDYVIAGDGSKTKVTGVFPQGEKEIFEIEFSDGSKTKCCDEHLWHTETEKDRKNQRHAKRNGKQREYLGSVKPLSEIRNSLIYQTQKNPKIPMVGRVSFEADALPFDAYALGALIGDGHFGDNCIDIACPDSEVTDAISLAIKVAGLRVSMKEKQQVEGRCKTFGITRDSMTVPKNDLLHLIDSLGLKGKLSYEKFIPRSYLFSSAENRLSMLQGLMDTDGYVCKAGVTVQFSSSAKQLADDVSFLVQSLGGTTSISSKIPTFTDSNGEKKDGMLHYTVHMRLPADVLPFRLSRKADRVKPKSKYIPVRFFTGVKSIGMAQAQCISVEHESHLYVTDDFIVTHNTLTALAAVQHAHNIGTKKRTVFALPNSVLSNWKKEAEMAYRDVSDCLYVGLRKKGSRYKYDSGAVDEDLAAITSGRYSKIFMTYEVLGKIPMRDETVAAYSEYLLGNDDSIGEAVIEQGESKKDKGTKARDKFAKENAVAKAVTSGRKSMSVPYFEDMGIDSIVIDEAHCFDGDTLVDGVAIKLLKVGDLVSSYNHESETIELKPIIQVARYKADGLVKVKFSNGSSFVCTSNHPVYTVEDGYINAGNLSSSYSVIINSLRTVKDENKLLSVRGRIHISCDSTPKAGAWSGGVLLPSMQGFSNKEKAANNEKLLGMRSSLRVEPYAKLESGEKADGAVLVREIVPNNLCSQAFGKNEAVLHRADQAGAAQFGAQEGKLASNAFSGREEQAKKDYVQGSCGAEVFDARRQWSGYDSATENVSGSIGLDGRICSEDKNGERKRIPIPLQTGYSEQSFDDWNRSGWSLSQVEESPSCGFKKSGISAISRVESVEILERASDGRFDGVCEDGYVYDIAVADNNNFFADGVLVHNCFKNSKRFTTTGNGAFTATKFVANPSTSDRGMDAQMKCWYVRGMSEGGDGVMALTATPVTNSPLEIYSMLSVAIGEKEVNAMMGCTGANSFMNAVCKIADQAEQTVTGEPKVQRTLTGIDNLQLVRRVLEFACIIETAESVAAKGIIIQVPESEEVSTSVELPVAMTNELLKMKEAYKKAAAAKKSGATLTGAEAKASSPFNLIRNMSKLIADEELYRGAFKFTFSKQDAGDAKKAVDAFNAMNITEERSEHELPAGFDPNTANGGKPVKSKAIVNDDTGEEELVFYVPIKAKIEGMVIEVPAVTYDAQDKLIKQLEKFGVEPLFSKASPKINAVLANVKEENANPRWRPPKQIVFCDELALHHKLRLMIAAENGIPKAKIVIVNAKSVSPADIQGIQDGFNASGEDAEGDDYNKYQIIIANKKAEVGINLQSGTQAVHHMTIGWTPDSVHQRNGRAVRQGNKIDTPIRVYHYDAAGTFDSYKRHLVNVKGDWIASIMDKDAKSVDIAGDLTTEDYENMANAIGDSQAMSRIQAESAAKAQKKLLQANMTAQTNSAANMQAASTWLNKYGKADSGVGGFRNWFASKNSAVKQLDSQIDLLQEKLDKTDNVMMQKRHSAKIAEIEVKRDAAKAQIAGVDVDSFGGIKAGYEQSEAYKNYQKEVTLNTKMRDESRNSFLLRDNLGYTKVSLESLEAGKAIIIGGRVVSNGDFMDVNGGLGVVVITEERNYRRSGKSTNDMVTTLWVQGEDGYRKMPLNSVSINRHAPIGTKAHADMLKELAAVCDKAVQNGYKEHGVWEFAPEISEAMSEVLPSPWFSTVNGNEYGFKAPLFPVYLNDHFGAEFDDLRAKQKELIEVKTDWQSKFRFHDLKNMVAIEDEDAAITAWLTANNRKLSAESASDLRFDIEKSSMEAHKAAVAESTTVTQYNDALVRKISDAEPAIEFKTVDDVVTVLGKYSAAMREIKKTHNALDDGSNPLPFDIEPSDIKRHGFPNLTDKLLAAIGNGEADESIYENDLVSRAHGTFIDFEPLVKLFVKLNGGSSDGDKITFAGDLANQLRAYFDLGASSIPKLSEYAFLKLLERTYARTIGSMAKSWSSQKAIKESKVNIDGMIEVLKSFDSINKIELGNTIYVKAKSRYSGGVTMQAGQYVILDLAYKGKVQSSISDKADGGMHSLKGRLFDDNTKRWYFPLMPLSFSDGKPVATVKDLLIHLGEGEKAKEIFGA